MKMVQMISIIHYLINREQICSKNVPTCMIIFIPYGVSSTWSPSCFSCFCSILITCHQHIFLTCHICRWYHRICSLYGLYWSLHRLLCLAVGGVSVAVIPLCHELCLHVQLILSFSSLYVKNALRSYIWFGFYSP